MKGCGAVDGHNITRGRYAIKSAQSSLIGALGNDLVVQLHGPTAPLDELVGEEGEEESCGDGLKDVTWSGSACTRTTAAPPFNAAKEERRN